MVARTCLLLSLLFQFSFQVSSTSIHLEMDNGENASCDFFQAITPPTRPPSIILGEKLTATTTRGESLREQEDMGEQAFPGDFVATTVQPSLFASSAVVEV